MGTHSNSDQNSVYALLLQVLHLLFGRATLGHIELHRLATDCGLNAIGFRVRGTPTIPGLSKTYRKKFRISGFWHQFYYQNWLHSHCLITSLPSMVSGEVLILFEIY